VSSVSRLISVFSIFYILRCLSSLFGCSGLYDVNFVVHYQRFCVYLLVS